MTFLLHLSDLHLVARPGLLYGSVDSAAALDAALGTIRHADLRPDAILVTGDVADHGDPSTYRAARERVESYADDVSAPVIWVNGNHDEVGSFREHLLDGSPVDRVVEVDGVRIIALDSTVADANHGLLDPGQLDFLRDALAGSQEPAVLALHHPPLRSPLPNLDRDMLRNRDDLALILLGSAVRMVVAGHTHYSGAGACGGVPVWIGGSTVAYSDVAPPGGRARAAAFASYSRIDIIDGDAVATAVPVQGLETILDFQQLLDGEVTPEGLAELGIRPTR